MKTLLTARSAHVAAAVAAAAGICLGTSGALAQSPALSVHDAWVREPMGGRGMTAAFAIVENTGTAARAIVSATADVAETVELHEMKMVDAMMRMSPVKQIDVPAGGKVELRPGGLHLMLFNLRTTPKAGDNVRLTLTFDDGTTVAVTAAVRKLAGMR